MCALIFPATFVWSISHSKNNWVRYDEKCTVVFMISINLVLFLSEFYETWIFSTDFLIIVKSHENPSNRSRNLPCGQKDGRRDGQTDRHKNMLFPILRTYPKKKIRAQVTFASLIISLCKCYMDLVNNFMTLCKFVMSPISLQTASPSSVIAFLPFDMWIRSTRYPQIGCSRRSRVMHHELKGKLRENIYCRPLEIQINWAVRSCNWMGPSTKVASKPVSWTRRTLSQLKLQGSQIMLATGTTVLRTEEAQQYCSQENRYACLRSATLGAFSCIRGIGKPAAKFLATYLSVSLPLFIGPWQNACKMHF